MAGYRGGGNSSASNIPITHNFTSSTSVQIFHNFSYRPACWIVKDDGQKIEAQISYGETSVTISLSQAMTGSAYLR